MKVYDLGCDQYHRFEGWFASEEDFLSQSTKKQIVCPICDSNKVDKLLSAPHLNLSDIKSDAVANSRSVLQQQWMEMRRHILENTVDVGTNFAEEARRIHYKEVAEHGIRGVASVQQCAELAEEGIDVFGLPLLASEKQSLQ